MCKVSIRFVVHPGQAKQRREAKCWGKAQRKENEAPCFSVRLFISRRGGRDGRARRGEAGEAGDNTHARSVQNTHNTYSGRGSRQPWRRAASRAGREGGRAEGRDSERHSGRPGNIATHTHTHAHTRTEQPAHSPPTGRPKISAPKQETATPACTRTTYRQTIHAHAHAHAANGSQKNTSRSKGRSEGGGRERSEADTHAGDKKKTGIPGARQGARERCTAGRAVNEGRGAVASEGRMSSCAVMSRMRRVAAEHFSVVGVFVCPGCWVGLMYCSCGVSALSPCVPCHRVLCSYALVLVTFYVLFTRSGYFAGGWRCPTH